MPLTLEVVCDVKTVPAEWMKLFLTPECGEFAQYWLGLQTDGLVPLRKCFKPTDIRPLLPFLTLIERLSDHEFRYRLVGTAVVSRNGYDSTGTAFSIRTMSEDSPFVKTLLGVLEKPCGYYLVAEERYRSGLKAGVEILGFPLADNDTGVPRFIANLSHECTKKYSTLLHDSSLKEMIGQVHFFLDIGADLPQSVSGEFTYTPRPPFVVKKNAADAVTGRTAKK